MLDWQRFEFVDAALHAIIASFSAADVVWLMQDCLRQHPEVLDDLHKADDLEKQSGLALPSAGR